ncbi:MFS transporter [Solirubrobacter phytolaccae]|uniref:MFS transporter n=1 Tax=Solirubrobacter phytolaccae TaxID=1404360 RepID=A0A9X3NDM9_9ACTN|nr:MFS transporter [Solirubrobacter phytolaccae]MDA0184513.1 MFS transporter [Solirubrobacter phytolaccae]
MSPASHTSTDPHHERRWLILAVLGIAQLMVVLDATIVNIALPSAQADIGFSNDSRQWVITAYALAFGSLLLLGGRIGDLIGRKQVFIIGLLGFAGASALGGAAGSFGVLVIARALQGVFGALLAPAALSLLTTTFTDPIERNKAFGVFGGIAGIGGGVGLLLGGVLTEYLSWRWCLYVNLLFAIPAAFGAWSLLHTGRHTAGARPRLDIPGAVTVTGGLFALVYGFSNAETNGWGAPLTIAMLVASVVLLVAFGALQRRVADPLLPLRVVLDRNRGGSYLSIGTVGAGMFGVFLFLTYYMQRTLDLSPIQTGLAFLPMNFAIMAMIGLVSTRLLPKFGPRPLIATGLALATIAMIIFAQLGTDSSYATGVLPGLVIMGFGMGFVFSSAMATATLGIDPRDAGVGSAMVNTTQQVGGSIGTALLSTLFASAVTSFASDNAGSLSGGQLAAESAMHGYTTAFWWAAGILVVGGVISTLLLKPGVPAPAPAGAAPAMAH